MLAIYPEDPEIKRLLEMRTICESLIYMLLPKYAAVRFCLQNAVLPLGKHLFVESQRFC